MTRCPAAAVESATYDDGKSVLVASHHGDPERERRTVEAMLERRVAGLLIVAAGGDHSWLSGASAPFVLVDRPAEGIEADPPLGTAPAPPLECRPASDPAFARYAALALGRMSEPTVEGRELRLRRLYPAAYADDEEMEAEYRALTHEELASGRIAAAETVEATLAAGELSADQLTAWMHAVNALRLVIGTMLDVGEEDPFDIDPSDPDARQYMLYGYLGVLLEEIVQAQLDD